MTWLEFWNAVKSGLGVAVDYFDHKGNVDSAILDNDLDSYTNQAIEQGGFIDGNQYKDPGERALESVGENGTGALDAYTNLVNSGHTISPDVQEAFNNLMSTEATNSARNFEEHMRDTDITSSAAQLASLGIGATGLAGSTASHSGVGAAQVGKNNPAERRYEASLGIAKELLSLGGSLAASGISSGTTFAVKKMAGQMALNAAHSGVRVVHHHYHR